MYTYDKALDLYHSGKVVEYKNVGGGWKLFTDASLVNGSTIYRIHPETVTRGNLYHLYDAIMEEVSRSLGICRDVCDTVFPTMFKYKGDDLVDIQVTYVLSRCTYKVMYFKYVSNMLYYADGKPFTLYNSCYDGSIAKGDLYRSDAISIKIGNDGHLGRYEDELAGMVRNYRCRSMCEGDEYLELHFDTGKKYEDDLYIQERDFTHYPSESELKSYVMKLLPMFKAMYSEYENAMSHYDEYLMIVNNLYEHGCVAYPYSAFDGNVDMMFRLHDNGVANDDIYKGRYSIYVDSRKIHFPPGFPINLYTVKYIRTYHNNKELSTTAETWYPRDVIKYWVYGDGTYSRMALEYFMWVFLMDKFKLPVIIS